MRAISSAGLGALLLMIAVPALGAPPSSLADAKKALDTARGNLTSAVERIQKDPPANADLDAAKQAVEALKVVIEGGAEWEPKDLDYAKAALAARKELRTQRDYVDDRRAKVKIHESRRELDRAEEILAEAVKRLDDRSGTKDFQDARAAGSQLEKLVEAGQPFAPQDSKYASHLAELKNTLAKQRRAIDEREAKVAVAKQKSLVEDAKGSFTSMMSALEGKKPTDAQFDAADAAITKLSKLLDDGRALEAGDKDYRTYAVGLRDQLGKAKKRIETLWGEAGLANLKGELEPARVDLASAGKALRKTAGTDQLAEARTAAIVLRKLLEKAEHASGRSKTAEQYVGEVRKSLLEVEVDLNRRRLTPAREALSAAMKPLGDRNAGEDAFKAAEASVKDAQKLLAEGQAMEKDDKGYASIAADFRKKLEESTARIATRRSEIEVGRQKAALSEANKDLERAVRALERRAPTDEQFGEANSAAIVLEKTLQAAPAKEPEIAKLVDQLRGALKSAKSTIEKRRLEVDLERQRAKVELARGEMSSLVTRLQGGKVTEERLKEIEDACERAKQMLAEGAKLVGKDRAYDTYDREVKKRIEETLGRVAKQRDTLSYEAMRAKVEVELKEVSRTLGELDGQGAKAAEISAVEAAIKRAEDAFTAGTPLEEKIAAYGSWAKQGRKTLDGYKTRFGKRRITLAAGDGRSLLKDLEGAVTGALELAKQPEATEKDITAASDKVKAFRDEIARGASLERDDRGYASFATQMKKDLERFEQQLALATVAGAFRKETLEKLVAGTAALEAAPKAHGLRAQKEGYDKAIAAFKACERGGGRVLDENPGLKAAAIFDGKRFEAKELIAECVHRAEAADPDLKKLIGLLTFEEGPKASFEKGKALLSGGGDKTKIKNDALAMFGECISSGKILQHKNPELKDKKFDVAGGQVTLAELITTCTNETQKLRGK